MLSDELPVNRELFFMNVTAKRIIAQSSLIEERKVSDGSIINTPAPIINNINFLPHTNRDYNLVEVSRDIASYPDEHSSGRKLAAGEQRWLTIGENIGAALVRIKATVTNGKFARRKRTQTVTDIASTLLKLFNHFPRYDIDRIISQQHKEKKDRINAVLRNETDQKTQRVDVTAQERIQRYKASGL